MLLESMANQSKMKKKKKNGEAAWDYNIRAYVAFECGIRNLPSPCLGWPEKSTRRIHFFFFFVSASESINAAWNFFCVDWVSFISNEMYVICGGDRW